jgi:hypothetical protein
MTTIGPTPERLAKAGPDVEAFAPDESVHHRAIRMLDGHVLERMASQDVITGDQYNAGVQFYGDWYYSGLAASGVINPGRVVVDGGQIMHESDVRLAAMTRWKRAVQAIGIVHCQVLTDVVLNEMTMEAYGRKLGQAAPKLAKLAARVALIGALTELDHHYYGQRRSKQRASHASDYRPGIAAADDAA